MNKQNEMMELELDNVVNLQRGFDLTKRDQKPGNVPVVGSAGISGYHNVAKVKGPGITVGRSGSSVGKVTYVKKDFWAHNTVLFATDFHGNNPRFVYYLLKTLRLSTFEGGSAVPTLNRNHLRQIKVKIPNRAEQDFIARLLGDLDDKIDLNQQMNRTLEEIGKSIFKHWFIDFEFPNEEGEPYKSSGGEMVYNEELGINFPKDWTVNALDDVAEFTRGFSYKGSEKTSVPGDFVFVTLNNVREFGGFKREFSYITSDRIKEKHIVCQGDIVIANTEQTKTGTLLGYPALVEFPFEYTKDKAIFSHHITRVKPKFENLRHYLYYHLFIHQQSAVKYHTGSVIWALDVNNWSKNERIVLPPHEILTGFEVLMQSTLLKLLNNNLQVEYLSRIRDSVLPKLMTGKIRVPIEAR